MIQQSLNDLDLKFNQVIQFEKIDNEIVFNPLQKEPVKKVTVRQLKNMPPILGWDKLKPLPDRFTAYANPDWQNYKHPRNMVINPGCDELTFDGRPLLVDLFSGCGGFSLGCSQAGFRVIASVEFEHWCHVTYCNNIPHMQGAALHAYNCDIRYLSGREILLNAGVTEVDCVVGSPPCQGFSQSGKREIGDPRDSLLWEFGRMIKEIQPKTWMMENVPGLLSKKLPDGRKVFDTFLDYMKSKNGSDFQSLITKEELTDKFGPKYRVLELP